MDADVVAAEVASAVGPAGGPAAIAGLKAAGCADCAGTVPGPLAPGTSGARMAAVR